MRMNNKPRYLILSGVCLKLININAVILCEEVKRFDVNILNASKDIILPILFLGCLF